ncbi:hypothetical protein BDV09DRAFT_199892 [Aspergillus tetrazonus]
MPMTKSLKHYRLPKKLRVEDWIDVIEDYSTRKLTVSNDRFIALSGIAHRFQQDLQLQYIAGLWHSEKDQTVLLRLLLWTSGIENAEHEADWMRSARYNGPSWSWATSKCPIVYNSPSVLPVPGYSRRDFSQWHAKIHSTYVVTNGLNPFAYVKEARLTISAPRKQIKGLCRSSLNNYYIFDPLNGPEAKIGTISLDAMDSIPYIYDENNQMKDRVEHGKDGAILPSCLHIVDVKMGELSDDIVPYGLLITPCRTKPSYWRRVGLFCLLILGDSDVELSKSLKIVTNVPGIRSRTIGVPSKWDKREEGAGRWMVLFLQNSLQTAHRLDHDWFGLRNREPNEPHFSDTERDEAEEREFS